MFNIFVHFSGTKARVEDKTTEPSEMNTVAAIKQTHRHKNIGSREKILFKHHESMTTMRPSTLGLLIDISVQSMEDLWLKRMEYRNTYRLSFIINL